MSVVWLYCGCDVAAVWLWCDVAAVWLWCGCDVAVVWQWRGCSMDVVWLWCVYPVFIALPSDAGQVSTHRLLLLQLLLSLRHPADQRLQRAQQVLPLLCASLQAPPETHDTG